MWFNYGWLIAIITANEVAAKLYPLFPKSNQNIAENSNIRTKRQFGFQDSFDENPGLDDDDDDGGFNRNPPNDDFFNNPNGIFFDEDNRFSDFVPGSNPRRNENSALRNRPSTTQRPSFVTPSVNIPGMGTTRSACEDQCLTTSQYNPVCGDNRVTYMNVERFNCAVRCGRNIRIAAYRACPRIMVK